MKVHLSSLRLLWPYVRQFRFSFSVGILSVLISIALSLIQPFLLRIGVDGLQQGRVTVQQLIGLSALIVGLAIIQFGLLFIKGYLINRNGQFVERSLRSDLFDRLQGLDQSFYDKYSVGSLITRSMADITAIRRMINQGLTLGVSTVALAPATFILMFVSNLHLALIASISIPFLLVALALFGRRTKDHFRASQEQLGNINHQIQEVFSNIRLVKAYGREIHHDYLFAVANQEYLERNLRLARYTTVMPLLVRLALGLSMGLLLLVGSVEVVYNRLTVGEFIQFNAYFLLLATPLTQISQLNVILQSGLASVDRLNEIFFRQPEVSDRAIVNPEPIFSAPLNTGVEIEFKEVGLQYSPGERWALRNVSFRMTAGQVIAVVGPTGSGKSSIAALLCRVYEPQEGRILLNGRDIREIPIARLRESFTYVQQQPILFSLSLRDNIAFGDPQAPIEAIWSAAQLSCLDQDITRLPGGLATMVGERGVTLSGGQKQRVAIARALLRKAPVLVLDDAFSGIDVATQNRIASNVVRANPGQTVILNSQHVSPVCEADNILVFDSGRIVEQGTHRELLDQGGLYARMYAHERLTAESQMSLDGIDVVDNLSNSTQIARDVPVPLGDTVGGYRSSTIKSEDKGQRRGPTVAEKLVDPQVTDELDTEPYTGRRLWGLVNYVRPYRKLALTVAPLVIIAAVFELSGPLLVKRSIDQYIVPKALDGLGPIVGVYWTVTVLLFLVRYVVLLSTSTIGQRVVRDLRIEVFKHILKQSLSFFDRQPVGRLMARLTTDVSAIDDFIRQGSAETLADVVMLISIVAAMFLLDWRLSFVCLSMLPVLATVSILYQRRLTQLYRLIRVRTSALSSYMAEQYGGMLTVQLFNRQAENRRAFEALNVAYTEATRKKIYADSLFTPTVMFLSNLAVALLLLLGGLRMIGAEAMSIGLLVAFLQYIDRTFAPVTNLAEKYGTFQDAIISAERIFNVLNLRPTLQDLPKPESLSMSNHISDIPDRGRAHLLGHIEFSGVYFSYDNVHPVLKNVSFEIKPGQRVAIIGRTGAGKTSIINVLCRFYEVQGGTVRIDGNDIRTMRQVDIRRQIALVLQDPMLFSGSIADNIRYGNERMTIEEVRRAAEYIGADRFISGLPGRYQYQLSVRGSNLSAGQRQLICFARAIALNPAAILVLDEATSNVDPESEVIIYDALQKLVSGRTSLTIAHRLSTVRNAELMIVLDQGRIVEIGSPGELLTRQGYYHSLLRHFAHQNTRSYGDFRTAAN